MVKNSEILEQVKKVWPCVLDIRKTDLGIEVKIPATPPYGWIRINQATVECERIVKRYLQLGYEIE